MGICEVTRKNEEWLKRVKDRFSDVNQQDDIQWFKQSGCLVKILKGNLALTKVQKIGEKWI